MTAVLSRQSSRAEVAGGDVQTIHYGKSWEQFKHLQKRFENSSGIKLSYYKGIVIILMTGVAHELLKTVMGMLIEAFLLNREIEFLPTGSATKQKEGVASTEPDESYQIQEVKLAVEVNFTSGDESKLERYRELAVDEVWMWENGVLSAYALVDGAYELVSNSQIPALSSVDLEILSKCILLGETSRVQAAKKFLEAHPKAD